MALGDNLPGGAEHRGWVNRGPRLTTAHLFPLSTHTPYLVLQDEVTGLVQWMVMQICLGRKHKQLWQQGDPGENTSL